MLAGGASDTPPDIVLVDGDRIVIPRRFLSVSVQGEVRSPGYVAFEAGRGVSYYARAAGGFTHRANPGRVRVTLARTDQQVSASEAGPLNPGDTVWVPAKREHSVWGQIRDGITTAAQVATVYLVIREATK